MDQGIGEGFTDPDHPALAAQLFASYARAAQVRILSSVVGREGLTATDRLYLDFGDRFEAEFVQHAQMRELEESLAIGWEVLSLLPAAELTRLSDAQIAAHIAGTAGAGDG
ncbi:MAG: hypothetical protein R3D85_14790 [Paracoccaceae bacterium]